MANQIPIKVHNPEPGLAEFQTGDTIAVEHGGTVAVGGLLTNEYSAPFTRRF